MPNVEIHGLRKKEARELRKRIFRIFEEESFAGDMVVTIVPSEVEERRGTPQPFIRVTSTEQSYLKGLIQRLRETIEMDVEHSRLEAFYPKKE